MKVLIPLIILLASSCMALQNVAKEASKYVNIEKPTLTFGETQKQNIKKTETTRVAADNSYVNIHIDLLSVMDTFVMDGASIIQQSDIIKPKIGTQITLVYLDTISYYDQLSQTETYKIMERRISGVVQAEN